MYYKQLIKSKELRFKILSYFSWVPDKPWLQLLFRIKNGYWMDFDAPKTFNEKLQWLKINGFRPEYTQLVDKNAVKGYVAKMIGPQYVIPTIGIWEKPEDIDWEQLPDEFVLKTSTGGGSFGVWIVNDKTVFEKEKFAKEVYKRYPRLGRPHKRCVNVFREHPYDDVPERILAEQLLKISGDGDLRDYKFFCFKGTVRFFKVDFDRAINHHANYYSPQGDLLPYGEVVCPPDFSAKIEIPENIGEMIQLAEVLSQNIPFVRVDLYNVDGRIYFGELTFFPASGLSRWTEPRWDEEIGEMLDVDNMMMQ